MLGLWFTVGITVAAKDTKKSWFLFWLVVIVYRQFGGHKNRENN